MASNESQEMYLKTILLLVLNNQSTRSVDVANELGYSKASVSRAVNIMKNDGLIEVVEGGNIVFTKEGREKALAVFDRYMVIKQSLLELGVDPATAHEDACKLEHVISDATFEKMKERIVKRG